MIREAVVEAGGRVAIDPGRTAMISALRVLPRNAMSRVAGWAVSLPLPRTVVRAEIQAFARAFDVNLEEVREPLDSFPTLQSFFTRALKDGVRPIDPDTSAFVSPCDGAWGEAGTIVDGKAMQIKGTHYSVQELVADADRAASLEGGTFATFYLSPRDYHRFHAPCAGRVVEARYLPGSLWPVNRMGLEGVPGLFARNERIVTWLETASGPVALVPVGATMVGKIRLTFDAMTTNEGQRAPRVRTWSQDDAPRLTAGEEWGRFEFGSTIVVLAPKGVLELNIEPPGTPLRLGRRVGRLLDTKR